ncbi:DUF4352 domain-containing protein [Streptomyces sp. NPDC026092]|uniref:DUF4352 domain-containing protein n=1 Tax=Streptomyces sp. NPDC026092 TaxID=3154797 RepID=UPI0033BFBF1A
MSDANPSEQPDRPTGPPSGPLASGAPRPPRGSRRSLLVALICGTLIVVAVAVIVALVVTDGEREAAGTPTTPTVPESPSSRPTRTQASEAADADDVHAFGETERYADGVDVTVSAPQRFTPSDGAAGHTAGNRAVKLEVTVRNGSEARVPLVVIVQGRDAQGREVERVFDDANDLGAGLMGTLLPGRTAVGTYAFDVPGGSDGTLDLEVTVGVDRGPAFWSGKVP